MPLYQERGFRLPEHLSKSDTEPDLCDICARAKPTFSHTFTPQTRSEIKGKLWYFDVSGGGNLTPSLIEGNIYTSTVLQIRTTANTSNILRKTKTTAQPFES